MRHCIGVGDLWLIAGQSNSVGYGRGPYNDPPEPGIHMFRHNEQWALATHPMGDSTDTCHPVNQEGANPGHSPYLQFARVLRRALGYPIGLIPTALGGSPLSRWNPAEPGPSDLFENMVQSVQRAGGVVRGMGWYQGESDTSTTEIAVSYADRFVSAVRAWREALHAPELPLLTVQLNRTNPTADTAAMRNWSLVRECQRQMTRRLSGVAVVPSLDLTVCDGIHTSAEGNLVLGERLARAALGMVYGRSINWQAPDLQSATRLGNGDVIELKFVPVTSRIASMDSNVNPFLVEDKEGPLAVRKVVYTGCDTIRIELERTLGADAKVHGGYGVSPALMPSDFERLMPVLAFYGVKVT
jgi:sialate O-acetylesterase